ncbi:MAG: phage holin [Clostridia bacterium]|nr:phage holin [Clostridia bacterium]
MTAGTIARTVVLGLALINQVLVAFGVNTIPIADDTVTALVSAAFTIGSAVAAWWKNNSFTKAAVQADAVMNELKTQK